MKNPLEILSDILRPKYLVPLVIFILILSIVASTIPLWYLSHDYGHDYDQGQDFFSGFSKLIISPAYAEDNFELIPTDLDSLGVEANSIYVLKSKEPIDTKLIKKHLKIEPKFEYDLKKINNTEWQIIPKKLVAANTLVKIALATSYIDKAGEQKERDYSWAWQVKDSFKVIHSIPRGAGTSVPTNTGIEVTFSHDNFINFEKYFSIIPDVVGKFEKHGRTLVFVPTNNLQPGKLYTVTVKKGLPLSESAETLSEDYSFTFETQQSSNQKSYNQWLYVYNRFIEVGANEAPIIQISAYNLPDNKVDVSVYKYANWQDYMKALRERDTIPWWAYSKDDFREDVSALKKISSFQQTIKQNNRIKYIEFPDSLEKGFYVIELTKAENKNQVWLQVSDLSAYINITKTDTLVWVNNLNNKAPTSNVNIDLIDTNHQYNTNQQGIVKFTTPQELIKEAEEQKQTKRYYFRISKNNDVLLMPASRLSRYYHYYGEAIKAANDYWQYLYTDRPRYQTTDTIKYWGMLKKRDNVKSDSSDYKQNATITLYKEGYIDYYYRPVRIVEQNLEFSDFDIFTGEIKLENVRPDYYTLEIKVGDEVIKRKYISIKPYIKPAYQLELIPDKKIAFADDNINLKVKASFFEGTAVPDLKLIFKTPQGEQTVITNDLGEVDLSYTKKYYKCDSDYSCWPDYEHISIRPESGELAEITADANLRFYGPKVYMQTEVGYPEKGMAEVKITSKFIDLDSLTDSAWWKRKEGEKPAPQTKIKGEVIKTTYTKKETGTHYDFINKKTYKTYQYSRHDETVNNFSITTDNQGNYTYRQPVEPETSYRIRFKIYDDQDRYDNYSSYLYYYDGRTFNRYSSRNYNYYHFELPSETKYSVGDEVLAKFMRNDEPMPAGKDQYLFMQLQNGLQEYSIDSQYEYKFKFEQRDMPNVNIAGVYFTGHSYITAHTSYYNRAVQFNTDNKKLKINIQTDKGQYKPGEEVEISLQVSDIDDKPVKTEVNLNLIDEAFYAIIEDTADPLGNIYANLSTGSIFSKTSHYAISDQFGGVEKGGCFARGTKILMADGNEKVIEDIKVGDKIKTFTDPINLELAEGKVTEIFQHIISEYLIINNELKVTPEHLVYASHRFQEAGALKIGDWLLNYKGEKVFIQSIKIEHEIISVYNFQVDSRHTYFADSFYVHNEKGGGPREFFTDAALFESVQTNNQGKAKLKFILPDNITSWRVTAQGISKNLFVGTNVVKIPVSLPVFEEVTIGNEYLVEDKPIARLRAFGAALNKNDQTTFTIKAPSMGVDQSAPLTALAFQPAYFALPDLKIGNYNIIYELKTEKGEDAVKLPINVIKSRMQAQFAKNEKLTIDTKVTAENNQSIIVVLSDQGQNQLYCPLQNLSWSWGDRVDQIMSRKKARILLQNFYNEEIKLPKFEAFNYQVQSGGITLLPYSSEELELSARVAAVGALDFDQESLAQYFFKKLEDKNSNREEISLALFGLASLKKPVLPRIKLWLTRDDLSAKEEIYLAQALFDLGDKGKSRKMYYEIMEKYAEKKDPHIIIRVSEKSDEIFHATALAAVLAASLNTPEANGFFNYLIENQKLWGKNKNSENLFNLEKLNYIEHTLPNLKPSPAKIAYELFNKRKEVKITGGSIHSFKLEPKHVNELKFLSIEGDVGISTRYTKPIDLAEIAKDSDISIKREYYVNGKKTNSFKEADTIEIRLYPSFGSKALNGYYQITDILPSGLAPIINIYSRDRSYNCHYWYPYNSDGQMVKYRIHRDWRNDYCGGNYIVYYARVKNCGGYKAEPAIIQSFINPDYINYSKVETVKITQ